MCSEKPKNRPQNVVKSLRGGPYCFAPKYRNEGGGRGRKNFSSTFLDQDGLIKVKHCPEHDSHIYLGCRWMVKVTFQVDLLFIDKSPTSHPQVTDKSPGPSDMSPGLS